MATLSLVAGFVSTNYFIRNIFMEITRDYNILVVDNQMGAVDRIIYRRLECWKSYVNQNNPVLISSLVSSNQEFGRLDNIEDYISRQDKSWQSSGKDEVTPFMSSLLSSPLALELKDRIDFYNKEYGYDIFPEAFVTNKYGAIVSASGKTTDYNQADEDWWQRSVQKGLYVSDIIFDESTNSNSLIISLRIDDGAGNFVGVFRTTYDSRDIFDVVKEIKTESKAKSLDAYLVTSDGRLIYSVSDGFGNLEIAPEVLKSFFEGEPHIKDKIAVLDGAKKFFVQGHSQGYKYFSGLGWSLIVSYDTDEVFSLLRVLNNNNFLTVGLIGIFIIILFFLISIYVLKPLGELNEDVLIIERGNLNHHSKIKSKDEIGDLARAFNSLVDSVKKSRSSIEKQVEEQTKDIRLKSQELRDQKDAMLNILEDVERQKSQLVALAEDLQKFRLAVAEASDHIVITDAEGIILYANKAVEEITGFSPSEVIGKKVGNKELWGGLMDKEFYVQLWKTIKFDKKPLKAEINNKRRNGELYTVSASITPIVDEVTDEVKFFVGIERDITKEKAIDKAKTEFVSLASHQLRTPLSTIRWYTEMVLAGDMGEINEKQRKYIEEIDNANGRMIDLVNALLNTSRIELGTFMIAPEPVDLKQVAQQALEEIQEKVQKKGLIIKEDSDPDIPITSLDPRLTHIILQNLLSNAAKYTLPGGTITWAIKMSDPAMAKLPKDKKYVLIKVSDTGVGIPPEAVDKIYSKLYRADNARSMDPDGTGLGLYLTKSIVDNAKGRIWFETEINKGTTFYVALPLSGMEERKGTKALSV
jgi:PAS domain S-box-containing protein